MQNRRVIAIDPGYDRLGVAVCEKDSLLFSTCITTDRKLPHHQRLLIIGEGVRDVINKWQPQDLAIESLFFNQNTSNALKVAEARGIIFYEAGISKLGVYEYSPQDVKIAVTGYGKADKLQVETMVRRLLKMDDKKRLDDELDAIAIGICHTASVR